jgi:Skp family chaperone for outer membrane proteins
MRVYAVVLALGAIVAPSFAQVSAAAQGQTPPPRPAAPAPAAPAPAAPRPTAPPPAAVQAPAPPAVPFQTGLKYAYINVQQIAAESVEGRAANERVKALNDQKVKELNDRNRQVQATQQKIDQGGSVLNDAARGQLQADLERQQRDIQRFTEDAQQDVAALQQQLQEEFQRKLNPIIDRVAREKQVHMIFSAGDSGLVWADPTLNLTPDVIKAFDASAPSAARPATPATPAAPAAGK